MSLPNLPFPVPVAELGWDKFDQVPEAANLDRNECITVMKLVCGTVCGDPPPGFDTRSWWQTAPTNVETLVLAVDNLKDTLGILGVYIYIYIWMFFPWYSLWIGTTSLKEFYISSIGGLFGFPADGFWESCWFDTFADGYLWCVCVYAYVHKCVYIYIYI